MEKKLNLILKVLALRLTLENGFTEPLVEVLVKEIEEEVKPKPTPPPAIEHLSPLSEKSRTLKNFITKKIRKGD